MYDTRIFDGIIKQKILRIYSKYCAIFSFFHIISVFQCSQKCKNLKHSMRPSMLIVQFRLPETSSMSFAKGFVNIISEYFNFFFFSKFIQEKKGDNWCVKRCRSHLMNVKMRQVFVCNIARQSIFHYRYSRNFYSFVNHTIIRRMRCFWCS